MINRYNPLEESEEVDFNLFIKKLNKTTDINYSRNDLIDFYHKNKYKSLNYEKLVKKFLNEYQ